MDKHLNRPPPSQQLHIRCRRYRLCIAFLLLLATTAHSQGKDAETPANDYLRYEQDQFTKSTAGENVRSVGSPWLDVTFYALNLRIIPSDPAVSGSVLIRGICHQDNPQFLILDLTNSMVVDSAKIDGVRSVATQQAASFTLSIDSTYHDNDQISALIYYHGTPSSSGLGSFVITSHGNEPWIWSLSEPYGARDWWPCKDVPSDKADSVDITITTDSAFKVGSNGILASIVSHPDGTTTWFWKERYPIATYLVSVAITNFAQFSNWFHYSPVDSLQVLNFVLPESLAAAQRALPRVIDGLGIFSGLFGLYPFIKEKYGHAEFGGLAMEHQTMTSTPSFDEETIIHELSHQWFGDMITCRSWQHLWLNEGFATYCQALFHERNDGTSAYRNFIAAQLDRAKAAVGSVYVSDTSNVRSLFNGARVYSKGAVVLHMLRHILGDTVFFHSLYNYANDLRLKYSTAVTEDFRSVCEQTSHSDLGYFFNEWIYGENYPHYVFSWSLRDSAGSYLVKLRLQQTTGTTSPSLFTMPIDIRFTDTVWDSTVTIFNDSENQTYSFTLPHPVTSVQLDPENWIMKDAIELTTPLLPTTFTLFQNYPNPFNSGTAIKVAVPHHTHLRIDIFNTLGVKVTTLFDGVLSPGIYTKHWNPLDSPTGIYYYRLTSGGTSDTRRMILVK